VLTLRDWNNGLTQSVVRLHVQHVMMTAYWAQTNEIQTYPQAN